MSRTPDVPDVPDVPDAPELSEVSRGSEVDLLREAAAGESNAARRLIDDVGPVVYGYVYVRLGGDRAVAEDVVQDTFLEAMRSAGSFRGDSALTTWMCTIARRRLARHFEAERRRSDASEELAVLPTSEAADEEEEVDDRDLVVRGLRGLSVLHRQVLVFKYLDGQSVAEIADTLGKSRVQVQSLLQRARSALRHHLEAAT